MSNWQSKRAPTSQETKDKISKAKKGKPSAMLGKKLSQETKDKISASRILGIFLRNNNDE